MNEFVIRPQRRVIREIRTDGRLSSSIAKIDATLVKSAMAGVVSLRVSVGCKDYGSSALAGSGPEPGVGIVTTLLTASGSISSRSDSLARLRASALLKAFGRRSSSASK